MSDNLNYIDNYFRKELTADESRAFEQRIVSDPLFAEEVAFYLDTKQVLGMQLTADKKERFRKIYEQERLLEKMTPVRKLWPSGKLWPYISAAAVTIVFIARFVFMNLTVSPLKLADDYINENFVKLGTTMGPGMDSIAAGKQFFEKGKFDSALIYFESILNRDTTVGRDSALFKVTEFAGITSLKLKHYDGAIEYFSRMENVKGLYANPGMFYHSIALIERNKQGDKEEAKKLLQRIVDNGLTEKKTAKKWLDKF